MAATPLTPAAVSPAGTVRTLAAANADGHTLANDGHTFVEVANGGGGSINVVVTFTIDGGTVTRTVAVAAGATKIFGGYQPSIYGATLQLTFSAVTSVTIAAFQL